MEPIQMFALGLACTHE